MSVGMGAHSPSNILQHLQGIEFPARKGALIAQARRNHADDQVLDVIRLMPETEYASMADVLRGVGKVEWS